MYFNSRYARNKKKEKQVKDKAKSILEQAFSTYAKKETLCVNGIAIKSSYSKKSREKLITKFRLNYRNPDNFELSWWNNITGKGNVINLNGRVYDNQNNKTKRSSIVSEVFSMMTKTESKMVVLGILMRGDYPAKSNKNSLQIIKDEVINGETHYLLHWRSKIENEQDKWINSFDTKFWISRESKLIYKVEDKNKHDNEIFTEYYFYDSDCNFNDTIAKK